MLRKELAQITSDLTSIIEAVKKYKESPEDYNNQLMKPRLGKRNFMDFCEELRAKHGRITVYATKEKLDIDANDIKEDILTTIKTLQEDLTAVKAVSKLSEEIKEQCHNILLKFDKIISENELKKDAGNKPAL